MERCEGKWSGMPWSKRDEMKEVKKVQYDEAVTTSEYIQL